MIVGVFDVARTALEQGVQHLFVLSFSIFLGWVVISLASLLVGFWRWYTETRGPKHAEFSFGNWRGRWWFAADQGDYIDYISDFCWTWVPECWLRVIVGRWILQEALELCYFHGNRIWAPDANEPLYICFHPRSLKTGRLYISYGEQSTLKPWRYFLCGRKWMNTISDVPMVQIKTCSVICGSKGICPDCRSTHGVRIDDIQRWNRWCETRNNQSLELVSVHVLNAMFPANSSGEIQLVTIILEFLSDHLLRSQSLTSHLGFC
jgi:hypothetical protein